MSFHDGAGDFVGIRGSDASDLFSDIEDVAGEVRGRHWHRTLSAVCDTIAAVGVVAARVVGCNEAGESRDNGKDVGELHFEIARTSVAIENWVGCY